MDRQRLLQRGAHLAAERRGGEAGRMARRVAGREAYLCGMRALVYGGEPFEGAPLCIDLHGGGFIYGLPEDDDELCARVCAEAGVRVISPEYPRAPEHMFPEAAEAVCALLQHCAARGGGNARIALMGHSAGGNLAIAAAMLAAQRGMALHALVADYPIVDMASDPAEKPLPAGSLPPGLSRLFTACYVPEGMEAHPLVSPLLAEGAQLSRLPQTLVVAAGQDTLCREAEQFAERLRALGVAAATVKYPFARHGFTCGRDSQSPAGRLAVGEIAAFLRRTLH